MTEFSSIPAASSLSEQLDEATSLASYRPLSMAAIWSAALGVLSAAVLISPLLLVVPVVATVLGLVALTNIRRNADRLAGTGLATLGLCLAILFASASVSMGQFRALLLAQQASPWAEEWFRLLLNGKAEAAYELTLPPQQRSELGTDLVALYREDADRAKGLLEFRRQEVPELCLRQPAGTTVQYRQHGRSAVQFTRSQQIQLKFDLLPPAGATGATPVSVVVEKHASSGDLPPGWSVAAFAIATK